MDLNIKDYGLTVTIFPSLQISTLSVTVDDQRSKIVDAEYLISSMRDEQERLAHDQNVALESAMQEIQAVKEALRRAEKEREMLSVSTVFRFGRR